VVLPENLASGVRRQGGSAVPSGGAARRKVAAAGDIACPKCRDRATSNLIVGSGYDRVLTLGDNAYQHGTLREFRTHYDPDWGRFKGKTYPSPGNHDPYGSGYRDYFRSTPRWYARTIGSWRVISLDSNAHRYGRQTTFLERQLRDSPRCVLAYWHHPRFSSSSRHHGDPRKGVRPAMARAWWWKLYRSGAEIVLNGHAHTYERFTPMTPRGYRKYKRGIREFVVGTGGRGLYDFGRIVKGSRRRVRRFGVLQLRLRTSSYRWKFISIDGRVRDSGMQSCH
jgi:hypothetical protein